MNTNKLSKNARTYFTLLLLLLLGTSYVSAEEFVPANENKKEVYKTFQVSLSDDLSIDNRYGDITVTHWDKKEIEIRVVIEAKANTKKRVEELLTYVSINLDKTGSTVHGSTSMKNFGGTKNNERLTINYYISKPSKVKPTFELRYGNVNLPRENDAPTTLEVKYGNINAGNFTQNLKIECTYGNIEVANLNEAYMDLAYCGKVKTGNAKVLTLESKYSNGEVKDMEQLNLELSYGNFKAGNIGIANVEAKYSNLDINRLEKHLYADFSYGTINVKATSSSLNEIKASSRYGNLNLTLPIDMAFNVIAEDMKYGNYNISDRFNVHTSKNDHDFSSKINNGHASRKIRFHGNNYGNLTIKAQ